MKQPHLVGRGCREKLDFLKCKSLFSAQNPPHLVFCVEVSKLLKKSFKRTKNIKHQVVHSLQDLNSSRWDVASQKIQCLLGGRQIWLAVFFNISSSTWVVSITKSVYRLSSLSISLVIQILFQTSNLAAFQLSVTNTRWEDKHNR